MNPTRQSDCSPWLLILITVLILVVPHLICRTPPLLDYPSERSHPQWKSSRNLCQRSNLTTATPG